MSELEPRLRNWGRWVLVHRPFGRALSWEGNYRSPQHWDPPEPPSPPCDRRDALEIESAMCILPLRYHWLLTMRYVTRPRPPDPLTARLMRRRFRLQHTPDLAASDAMAQALLTDALGIPRPIRGLRMVAFVRRILPRQDGTMHRRLTTSATW